MYALGYIILAIAKVIGLIINIYTMIIVIAALITWVNPDPYNPIVKILRGLTEPAFRIVRRLMPRALLRLRIDISPIIVLVVLMMAETFLVGLLVNLAGGLIK